VCTASREISRIGEPSGGWQRSPASNRDRRYRSLRSPKPPAGCAGAATAQPFQN
jgi:hypothetical protein